jgi:peptidoglycan/LPS O-acetylase OafA/YrhL
VIAGVTIVAMLAVLPLRISLWSLVWCIGAAIAILDRYWMAWPFIVGATIGATCLIAVRWITMGQSYIGMVTQFAIDLAVALGFSIALLCAKNLKMGRKLGSLHRMLASFSYTVYLVHFPAMVFAAALLKEVFGTSFLRPPGVTGLIYGGALLMVLYVYAWFFAVLTEAHTSTVRARLSVAIPALREWARSLAHGRSERAYS